MSSNATPRLRVVAVHGISNSFGTGISDARKEELRALKAAACARDLQSGLGISPDRLDVDFAYYADRLRPGQAAQGDQESDFLNDPLAQEMLDAWARELGLPDEVAQGHAAVPLRALASWMARRFNLAEGPLGVFIRLLCRVDYAHAVWDRLNLIGRDGITLILRTILSAPELAAELLVLADRQPARSEGR